MDKQNYINLVRATNFIMGIDDQTNSNSVITALKDCRVEVYIGASGVEVHSGPNAIEVKGCRVEVHKGSDVIKLNNFKFVYQPDIFKDFPEAEMSRNPEDITWRTSPEGPISYGDCLESCEEAVKMLQTYLRNIDALADTFAQETTTFLAGSDSAVEVAERLAKDKQRVNKVLHTFQELLAKAKEHADEEAVTKSIGEMSLSQDT